MPQCIVCNHRDATLINRQLLMGSSARKVGDVFSVSKSTVALHTKRCLGVVKGKVEKPPLATDATPKQILEHIPTPEDFKRTEILRTELEKYEPQCFFFRQLERVEKIALQGESDKNSPLVLNAVEASRRLYSDAVHLFQRPEIPDTTQDEMLAQLQASAQTPEEEKVVAALLFKLSTGAAKDITPPDLPENKPVSKKTTRKKSPATKVGSKKSTKKKSAPVPTPNPCVSFEFEEDPE